MKKRWLVGGVAVFALAGAGTVAVRMAHKPAQAAAAHTAVFVDPPKLPGVDEAAAQARVKAHPGDAAAWALLGDVQLRGRAFPQAEASYVRAVSIDPKRAETWSALGEARMQIEPSQDGHLPAGAAEAFNHALALNPKDPRSRFYRTMEKDFLGQHDAAIGEWLAQLREAPMGSDADESIRAAITASVRRNQQLIGQAMREASAVQPRYRQAPLPPAGTKN